MNEIMQSLTAISLNIIGLATLAVLIRNSQGTAQVLSSSANALSQTMATAMTGGVGGTSYGGTSQTYAPSVGQ